MTQKPYANLGAGRIILPAPQPAHHGLVDPAIYSYPLWENIDRNAEPGIDRVIDLFRYPWPIEDNAYDGALLSHLSEHIPHEIRQSTTVPGTGFEDSRAGDQKYFERWRELQNLQDGWFAFFAELHRVLTPGNFIHILSPYATSTGAVVDPTHTRYLTPASFMHSMAPDPDAPFAYANGGIHFAINEPWRFNVHHDYAHLLQPGNEKLMERAIEHEFNVVYEFYLKLQVVK